MDSGTRPVGSCNSPAGLSREYKLVMLGAGGVGKSAMTMQFISHRFPEDHDPTIEDAYKIRIRIDDEPANLDILDTAGQAEFTAMRDQYMRAGEGFIICYSITDRRSFHEVREFKQLIYRVRRTDDTPVVLVGNKSDLKQLRQVSKEEGLALAREFSCPFLRHLPHTATTLMMSSMLSYGRYVGKKRRQYLPWRKNLNPKTASGRG